MGTVRATKRGRRVANEVPSVAIAGYTNAGKSSLLNALTGAGVLVQDALFATLDATTRRSSTPDGLRYTLTDTVGFVRHLPHQLVDAFQSTLDEVADAELIVHVVDGADPNPEWQVEAVREVLGEIADRREDTLPTELLVVNKTDMVDEVAMTRLRHLMPNAVFVSANSGAGIDELRERIAELLPKPDQEVEVLVPYTRGELVARVHREGEVLTERHIEQGTVLHAKVKADLAGILSSFSVNGTSA